MKPFTMILTIQFPIEQEHPRYPVAPVVRLRKAPGTTQAIRRPPNRTVEKSVAAASSHPRRTSASVPRRSNVWSGRATLSVFIAASMSISAAPCYQQDRRFRLLSRRALVVALTEPRIDVLDAPANRRRCQSNWSRKLPRRTI